jgi:hypothetical protein
MLPAVDFATWSTRRESGAGLDHRVPAYEKHRKMEAA